MEGGLGHGGSLAWAGPRSRAVRPRAGCSAPRITGRGLRAGQATGTARSIRPVVAICFDWDGTLVDSLDTFYRANAAVMAELGLPFDRAAYRRHYAPDWRLLYVRLGVPESDLDAAHDRWRRHFDPSGARPFPGTREAILRLHRAGYELALVTATVRTIVEPQLREFGLADLIPTRVFGDDLTIHKPDPAPLQLALRRLGLANDVSDVTYVGDAPDDMRMARRATVRAVGVEGLLGDRVTLRAAGADEVVPSVAAWVASLGLDATTTAAPGPRPRDG
jgi:HAD superfamily hydrolase (TIGR01509 family)